VGRSVRGVLLLSHSARHDQLKGKRWHRTDDSEVGERNDGAEGVCILGAIEDQEEAVAQEIGRHRANSDEQRRN